MSQRYEVTPGSGLVAREGDSVLWVTASVDPDTWDSLLELAGHRPGTDAAARDTASAIESVLGPLSRVPRLAFAALLVSDGLAQGVLYGPVTVRNLAGPAPTHGYGAFGITIPFPLSEPIYVGFTEADSQPAAQASAYLDLAAGVVPGSGMWLHPQARAPLPYSGAGAAAAAPTVDAEPPPTAHPQLQPEEEVGAALVVDAEQSHLPHPASAQAGAPAIVPPQKTFVLAPDDQPGSAPAEPAADPDRRWSAAEEETVIDAPPVPAGFVPAADYLRVDLREVPADLPRLAPLPPIRADQPSSAGPEIRGGVLVFDDGSTFSLDEDYVIGRKPERHALVQSGQARPLTVVDPDSVLSGAHAAVRLQEDGVYLEDLGSLNGSHIALPGANDWTRIDAHAPVRLVPGTRLLFGWTVATFSGG